MSALTFKPATKTQAKLRMALIGPAGSGKTMTALKIAQRLAEHAGKPIAFIDTEHGSASKYADLVPFDVMELTSFHPERYVEAIAAAQNAGYGVLVIDSLSHAWMGKDGALQLVDRETKRQKTANSYTAWGEVTPLQNALIEAMLSARLHIIVTMRSKMEYVQEKDANGKTRVRKIGLQPVQRDGMEFEFDVVADIDTDHLLVVGKTRCPILEEYQERKAGTEIAEKLIAWLSDGAAPAPPRPQAVPKPEPEKISGAQRRELSDMAKMRKIPTEVAASIVKGFGFERGNDVTVDKFEAVLDALTVWKAPEQTEEQIESQPHDTGGNAPDNTQIYPPLPTTEPTTEDQQRIKVGELVEALTQSSFKGNVFKLIYEECGERKVPNIPADALPVVIARLEMELSNPRRK